MKVKLFLSFISALLILVGCNSNQEKETKMTNDSITKSTTSDGKMMIIARLTVKADKVKDFTEAAKEMIEKSNKESGCKFYQLYQDPYESTKFIFVEEYTNQAAVDAHFGMDYFKAFGPKIKDLLDKPGEIKIVTVAKEEIK